MRNARRIVAPGSVMAIAVLAASVTVPSIPPRVESNQAATLTVRAPQTLQVQLAGLVELAIQQAAAVHSAVPAPLDATAPTSAGAVTVTAGAPGNIIEPVIAAPNVLQASASSSAVRPPPAYSPFYPFTTPTTTPGAWLTLPIAIPGLVFDSLAQSLTRDLTDMGLDARLANQPELLSRYLLVPIAVTIQTALTGLIGGGTVELGRFTVPQAVAWSVNNLRVAITNTIAAERDLLNGGTGILPEDDTVAAPAATATTKPRIATRPVAPAPADTQPGAGRSPESPSPIEKNTDADGPAAADGSPSSSSPAVETPTGHTTRFRLGPVSLPNPFTRSRSASPSAQQADPGRRVSISVRSADRG